MTSDQLSSCYGKFSHPSQYEAGRTLDRLKRKRQRRKVHVYRCQHCHQWHLGGDNSKEIG